MYGQATLFDYWLALYSRKKIILAVSISAMLFTLLISHFLPPIYEAKASFYVPTNLKAASYTSSSQERLAQGILKPLPDEKEAGINIGILKSNDISEKIHSQFPERNIEFFKKNVDFVTSPQLFTDIYVRDRDPRLAAAIANAYIEAFREFHVELLKAEATRAQKALENQLKDVEKNILLKTAEIREFKQQNNLVSSSEAEQLYLHQAQDLERQRNDTIVELNAVRERLGETNGTLVRGSNPGDKSTVLNPKIEQLRKLETKERALNEEIAKLRNRARSTVANIVTSQTLEADKKNLESLRLNVQMNLAEAGMQAVSPTVDVVQVQTAQPPKNPGFPIFTLNALVALILGFAAGCYYALLLEYLKRLKVEQIRHDLDESLLQEVTS